MWNSCNQGNQWWFGRLMNWWLIIKIEGSGICTLKDVTDPGWICRTTDSVDPSGKCCDLWIRRSIYWFIDPPIHWYTDLLIWGELPPLSLFLLPLNRLNGLIRSQWDACSGVPQSTLALAQFLLKDWKPVFINVDAFFMCGRCFIVHFFIF